MIWVLLFTLVGFGLRVQRLDLQPLWGDEGWSIYFAVQELPQLLALTALDIHPPLYYLLLKVWFMLTGVNAEAARMLSVFSGTLFIPALYLLGKRLFKDTRTGIAAAAVGAVMPLAVYYSQEVRMYQLVTLLGALSGYSLLRWQKKPHRNRLITYAVITAAALYTHYYAGFLVLAQALYLLLYSQLNRKPAKMPSLSPSPLSPSPLSPSPPSSLLSLLSSLLSPLLPLLWTGVLYLPWLVYLGPRLGVYIENKRDVEQYVSLNLIRFLGDHIVAFSVGHLSTMFQQYIWTALPFILVAVLGVLAIFNVRNRQSYLLLFYLLAPLLLGYLVNRAFPFTPRFFERTLLPAAPAYWVLIGAGIIWLWDRQYLLVGTFVLALLLITNISLLSFYTTPRYPNEDYRPLLQDIAARATPDDTLLASYQWQLGYYYAYLPPPRPRLFTVPGWGQGWAGEAGQSQLTADLTQIFHTSPRLWFPAHQALGHFWEDQAEETIARLGYPALLEWYSPQTKLTLAGSPATVGSPATAAGDEAVTTGEPGANFDRRLTLLAAGVGTNPVEAGRGIIPINLTWRKEKSLGSEYLVSVRLADAAGRTWAIRDSFPRAGQLHFTDLTPGDTLLDRHGLLIPAGTPPGQYRLLLSVRRYHDARPLDVLDTNNQPLGAELPLTKVDVIDPNPPVDPHALPVQFMTRATFAEAVTVGEAVTAGEAVTLIGYSLGHGPFKSGESLPLTLFWQGLAPPARPLIVSIQLKDKMGQPVVIHEQPPTRPTTGWPAGTLLRDPHEVALPPTLPPGKYQLAVGLLGPEKTLLDVLGDKQLILTTVTTVDRPRRFDLPEPEITLAVNFSNQVHLIGLDMPPNPVSAGEVLPLTLHWQANTTPAKSWKVFVHLLDTNGNMVAQQDQVPGAGQFPTTSWLPGETIADTYNLSLPAGMPPGNYLLEIGLYDANDFSRLPVVEDGEIVSDHTILESWPLVIK